MMDQRNSSMAQLTTWTESMKKTSGSGSSTKPESKSTKPEAPQKKAATEDDYEEEFEDYDEDFEAEEPEPIVPMKKHTPVSAPVNVPPAKNRQYNDDLNVTSRAEQKS